MTPSEMARCFRWPGACGVLSGYLIAELVSWFDAPAWLRIVLIFSASFFTTLVLYRFTASRYLRRKGGGYY